MSELEKKLLDELLDQLKTIKFEMDSTTVKEKSEDEEGFSLEECFTELEEAYEKAGDLCDPLEFANRQKSLLMHLSYYILNRDQHIFIDEEKQ